MANIQIGGDPEQYMQAPRLNAGGGKGGGGSFFATVLDLLGVHSQVAKGPAQESAPAPEPQGESLQILDQMEQVLMPRSMNPPSRIRTFDPNDGR